MNTILRIIFCSTSLVWLAASIYLYLRHIKLKKNTVFARGKITNVVSKRTESFGEKRTDYFPTVCFTDIKGKEHEIEGDVGVLDENKFMVDDLVEIVYQKDDPSNFALKKDYNLLFPITLFIGFLIFLFIGLVGD